MKHITTMITLITMTACCHSQQGVKHIEERGMHVSWHYEADRIHFGMSAPTKGWVTIGFNPTSDITGAYLLMGRIVEGKAEVVEHYTSSPGEYRPITALGAEPQVHDISGAENGNTSTISFSIPVIALSQYQQDLLPGSHHFMIMAYSQDDDFQHHSIMRTSVKVQL